MTQLINFYKFFKPNQEQDLNTSKGKKLYISGNYLVLYTNSKTKAKELNLIASHVLHDIEHNYTFFIITKPKKKEVLKELLLILKLSKIATLSYILYDGKSDFSYKRIVNPRKNWSTKLKTLKITLAPQPFETYTPPSNPSFFLWYPKYSQDKYIQLDGDKPVAKLDYFMPANTYDTTQDLYSFLILPRLLVSNVSLNELAKNKTIKAKLKDIQEILPPSLKYSEIRTYKTMKDNGYDDNSGVPPFLRINKIKDDLIFEISEEYIGALRENIHAKVQYVRVPTYLYRKALDNRALTSKGIPFLTLILYGMHYRKKCMKLKPSTIFQYANIPTKRGIDYIIDRCNRYMDWIKQVGVIESYKPLTRFNVIGDFAITIKLAKNLLELEQLIPPPKPKKQSNKKNLKKFMEKNLPSEEVPT